MDYLQEQKTLCKKYGVDFLESRMDLKVGVSQGFESSNVINGLRHPPEKDTTGWYIWSGELSSSDNFFKPLHTEHLKQLCPKLLRYLGLPAGFRFLVDLSTDYEDVWFDESLL